MKNFKRTMLFFVTCTLTQQSGTVNAATSFVNSQNQTTNSQFTPVVPDTTIGTHTLSIEANNFIKSMRDLTPSKEKLAELSQKKQEDILSQYFNLALELAECIYKNSANIWSTFDGLDQKFHFDYKKLEEQGASKTKLVVLKVLKEQYESILNIMNECIIVVEQSLTTLRYLVSQYHGAKNITLSTPKRFLNKAQKEYEALTHITTLVAEMPGVISKEIDETQKKLSPKKGKQLNTLFSATQHAGYSKPEYSDEVRTHQTPTISILNSAPTHMVSYTGKNIISTNAEYRTNNNIQENNSVKSENKEEHGGVFTSFQSSFNNTAKKVFQWVGFGLTQKNKVIQ